MKRDLMMKSSLVAMLLLVVVTAAWSTPTSAYVQRETGIEVRTAVAAASYQELKEIPVMVSIIKDGEVFKQKEARINSTASFSVPAGVYDVRVEGDGMQTLTKRGIHVIENEKTEVIGGPMRTGTGAKIVEYATGGLSREEIAARLAKLEAALADLQKSRSK